MKGAEEAQAQTKARVRDIESQAQEMQNQMAAVSTQAQTSGKQWLQEKQELETAFQGTKEALHQKSLQVDELV